MSDMTWISLDSRTPPWGPGFQKRCLVLLDDGEQAIWLRSSVVRGSGATHWMQLSEPPPRERSAVSTDQDTSEHETASERHSGGFTGKTIGKTSRWIDIKADQSVLPAGVRLNGTPLIDLADLRTWLTSYVEECRESRDAAADDGDYESALRHRTRVEVLEDVLGRIGDG